MRFSALAVTSLLAQAISCASLAMRSHSPLITMTSTGETRVAMLSDNPAERISVLRAFAADNDYLVNF